MAFNNWKELSSGDKLALMKIYKEYYNELFNYGIRICRSEEITRDCIQELFIKIWMDRSKYTKIKNPKPYIFRILRNTIVDILKSKEHCADLDDIELIDPFLSEEDFTFNTIGSSNIKKKLAKAIDKLTTRQREIILLKFYNGLSYDEISEITSIKNQSIRNIASNALKKLRISLPKSVLQT